MWTCSTCGLVYHPRPEPEATKDLYNADYFQGGRDGNVGYVDYERDGSWEAGFIWESLGRELSRFVPEKGRLLDVGCASGHFVEVANKHGWQGSGIDVSDYAVGEGIKKGLDLHAGRLQDAGFPPEHFSAVICLQTLEHLPEPKAAIEELHRITREGGVLSIDVPSADSLGYRINGTKWAQLRPPEHLQYFGRRSLRRLLESTGWEVVGARSLYYPVYALAHYDAMGGVKGKLLKGANRLMDRTGLVEVIRRTGLGTFLRMVSLRQ